MKDKKAPTTPITEDLLGDIDVDRTRATRVVGGRRLIRDL